MSNFKYDRQLTESHNTINQTTKACLRKINDKLKEDGYKGKSAFREDIVVIDTDKLKEILKKEEKSADMAFGVRDNNDIRFVICEIKLNVKSIDKVKDNYSNLVEKFVHTKDILGTTSQICKIFYILFKNKNNFIKQADNLLRRLNKNKKEYGAITVKKLHKKFFNFL